MKSIIMGLGFITLITVVAPIFCVAVGVIFGLISDVFSKRRG